MVEKVRSILQLKPVDREDLVDVRCIALKPDASLLLEMPLDDRTNDNSCLVTYFECQIEGVDLRTKMVHDVVMNYLDEPTFNQLRTTEQLGYVVFCRNCSYRDVMGSQFIIQSPTFSCEYIVSSLNKFLKSMIPKFEAFTDEEFKVQVESVRIRVAEKDYNLGKENGRFWSEIATHKYMFDRQEKELDILKTLNKEEFTAHFKKLFFSEQTKRLDVELTSEKHIENQKEFRAINEDSHFTAARQEVSDTLSAFKKKMGLHPDLFKAEFASFKL
jgi:insulysin